MTWFLLRKPAGVADGGPSAGRQHAGRAYRRLALACLAVATIGLDGCASSPCNGCGVGNGIGSGIAGGFRRAGDTLRDTTARVFHHKKYAPAAVGCDTCGGGGVVEGMPVEGAVISGGSIPGGVVPGPPPLAPAAESDPTILLPAAPAGTTVPGKSSSSVSPSGRAPGNGRAAYKPSRAIESDSHGRGDNLAQSAPITPRAERSAPGDFRPSSSPLDSVPPIDLAAEVAERGGSSPVPVEADLIRPRGVDLSGVIRAPKDVDLPAIRAGLDTTLNPGLKRFSGVKPNISGGSLPDREGLDWLKEKGIKTVVDLREPTELDSSFVDTIKAQGFRYVSLPINASKIDASSVARFNEEIARTDGQPVFFFDADGTRAGLLWYIHRLTVDKVDAQIAGREAEELGLVEKSAWLAATRYIDAAKASPAPSATGPSASKTSGMVLSGLGGPVVEWSSDALKRSASRSVSSR